MEDEQVKPANEGRLQRVVRPLRNDSTPDLWRRLASWRREANGSRYADQAQVNISALVHELLERGECVCDMRTKLVGDGCKICNPELWARYCETAA